MKNPASAMANGKPLHRHEHDISTGKETCVPIIPAPRIEFDICPRNHELPFPLNTSRGNCTHIRYTSHQGALRALPLGQEMVEPLATIPSVCITRWMFPCRGEAVEEQWFRSRGELIVTVGWWICKCHEWA